MKVNQIILPGLMMLMPSLCFGWGQKGHDTVAAIAEQHLTEATRQMIDSLLDGKSIVYYANWLDNASHTPEYAYSKTWHYKNIDADKTYENAPDIKEGNIVQALYDQTEVLQNPNATKDEKALALKMVVHFLGDIHQPMHMGRQTDLGGNRHYVKYFKSATNLHTVWDSRLPESAHKWSYSEWVDQIDRATPKEADLIVKGGTPTSWGKETYEICKDVYAKTPVDTNIEYDYISEWTPTVETQFLRGGLRLADLLNSVFDPAYMPQNGFVKK
ncbi:MAG: S1/P1 nuclease [Muribaculum sp.]|nr:S1/P1 nuclease [Muribaculum sp.]